jgi:hypothetical protein
MKTTYEQRSHHLFVFRPSLHFISCTTLRHANHRTLLSAPVYSMYAPHTVYLLHSLYCIYYHIGYRGVGVKPKVSLNIVGEVRSDLTS